MTVYVGLTDFDWYTELSRHSHLDEVNFWQPSGQRSFRALSPGDLFLFKLHAPWSAIVGGGYFSQHTRLPVTLAWNFFAEKNGAESREAMILRIERYVRRLRDLPYPQKEGHYVGCILLQQPFFFPQALWIPQPRGWAPNIVQGRTYADDDPIATELREEVRARLVGSRYELVGEEQPPRYGAPATVMPRLGQGSFRAAVLDAYGRSCAVTQDRVVYVLEASHIKPYAMGGEHRIPNGLLLRSDLHTLFDRGYVALDEQYRLQVSDALRDEFHNGAEYFALRGKQARVPSVQYHRPSQDLLDWHRRRVFRGAA